MKKHYLSNIYYNFSKVICGTAGMVGGALIGGLYFILPGALIGMISAHLLEQNPSDRL